jgi:hypothetical protein
MEEKKLLAQLVEEEEKRLKDHMKGGKVPPAYTIMEYIIKELFLLKNMLNDKRLFVTPKEEVARIFIRVYLLSNIAIDKLGYSE